MKTRVLPIILAGLLPATLGNWSAAAPAPAGGRPRKIASFQAHRYVVQDLAFSPDGKLLVTGGRDGAVKLWNVTSGKNLFDIQGPHRILEPMLTAATGIIRRSAWSVAFHPDGKTFVSYGEDRNVRFWDTATGRNVDTIGCSGGKPLLFSLDGKTLFNGHLRIDLNTKEIHEIVKGGGSPLGVAFDPKGQLLYCTTCSNGQLAGFSLWDVKTGQRTITCKTDSKPLWGLALRRDGKIVASIDDEQTLRLWDAATGKNTATFDNIPKSSGGGLAFSPDGEVLAMIHGRGTSWKDPGFVILFELSRGKIVATLGGHKQGVSCLAFSRDGQLLASGSFDGVIKIWSLSKRYAADKETDK